MAREIKKILVIKLSALGDFVQASGPMKAIRKAHPEADITLLTTQPYRGMAEATGWFDAVWDGGRPDWTDLAAVWRLIWRLRTPEHRSGALDPFWIARPPPFMPPWLARFESRRQALLARADVQTALAKVGRPVTTPLGGDYWGGF